MVNVPLMDRLVSHWSNRRGSITVLFAVIISLLVFLTGLGIEFARINKANSVTINALEAASQYAAIEQAKGKLTADEIQVRATEMFHTTAYELGSKGFQFDNLSIEQEPGMGMVRMEIEAKVKATFGNIFGYREFTTTKSSTAVKSKMDLELIMALDISGSMKGSEKIGALKNAATGFVDHLLSTDANRSQTFLGLVPYNKTVRVPTNTAVNLTGSNDVHPCLVGRLGRYAFNNVKPNLDNPNTLYDWSNSKSCSTAPTIPLTKNAQLLKSGLNSLEANGGTAGQLGMAIGWSLLQKDWQTIWNSDYVPAARSGEDVVKAVLIVAGGENNPLYLGENPNDTALRLCHGMKKQGILVFTLGFALELNSKANRLMRQCASDEDKAFFADNANDLAGTFQKIADSISVARVSE